MIDYKLYSELKAAIENKYFSTYEMYSEEQHKTYSHGKIWDNYGIKIVNGVFTIAVLCEFDQNDPDAGVYVGVKVLNIGKNAFQLSQYLQSLNPDGHIREKARGYHKRWFSWPYWKSVTTVKEGLEMFDKLLTVCNEYIYQKIF